MFLADPTFASKSCPVENFAVTFYLKFLVSGFIDIIRMCHENSTRIFEAVSSKGVLLNSALKLFDCEFSKRITLRRTRELDFVGLSTKTKHSSSIDGLYVVPSLRHFELESPSTRLLSKPL